MSTRPENDQPRPDSDVGNEAEDDDPRLDEVEGSVGMPGEVIDTAHNQPGSQAPPPAAEESDTAISDSKGTT